MPSTTPKFGLYLPLVNDPTDQDLWGGYINANLSSLDTLVQTAMNFTPSAQSSSFSITGPTAASINTNSANVFYACDATAAQVNAQLPAASTCNGMRVGLKKVDATANLVAFVPFGTDKIDGATTYGLSTQYATAVLVSDGTNWQIVANLAPAVTGVIRSVKNRIILATGTYIPSANLIGADVKCVGSGAGGCNSAGGGGAATAEAYLTAAQIGASQTVTVPVGGTGTNSATGNPGAACSFGTLVVANGGGASTRGNGGQGATTGTGDTIIPGSDGGPGTDNISVGGNGLSMGGMGGGSSLGQGAPSPSLESPSSVGGINAKVYGTAGSGSCPPGSPIAAGNGAQAVIYIKEYLSA